MSVTTGAPLLSIRAFLAVRSITPTLPHRQTGGTAGMEAIGQPVIPQAEPGGQKGAGIVLLYGIEALASVAGTLLSIGISFYMKERFKWELPRNFALAAAQGVVYVPGALSAAWVTGQLRSRRALFGVYLVLALLCVGGWVAARANADSGVIAALLLAYTSCIGVSWPILEGMVAAGGASQGMSRRLGLYNFIWPAAGFVAIALEGVIIRYWVGGIFLLPLAMHLICLVALVVPQWGAGPERVFSHPAALATPEPQLLRKRRLALWLSRTALPATYAVIYGLMPLMPYLPVMKRLPTAAQTAVASVWLGTRWLAFGLLALGSWWHTRPRVLLWAAVVMLVSFFGMTLPPTHGASPSIDLASLVCWQAVLGLALGMIYSGSLYFGMVLSEGSTEHGGYHEALIGLGWVLGPAAGAAAQAARPDEMWVGIAAVGAVICASVLVVLVTAVVMSRPKAGDVGD